MNDQPDSYPGPFIVGAMFPRAPRARTFQTFSGAMRHLTSENSHRGIPHQMHDGNGEVCVRSACYSSGSVLIQYRKERGTFPEERMPEWMAPIAEVVIPGPFTDPGKDNPQVLSRLKRYRTPDTVIPMGRGRKPMQVRGRVAVRTVLIKNPAKHAEQLRKKREQARRKENR